MSFFKRTTSGNNKNRHKRRKRKYASGKMAFVICDRTGFKVPYRNSVVEPGTGLRVDKRWSDGMWNIVDHPQNFPADVGEAINLENPRMDVPEVQPPFLAADEDGVLILMDGGGQPIFIAE